MSDPVSDELADEIADLLVGPVLDPKADGSHVARAYLGENYVEAAPPSAADLRVLNGGPLR